MLIQSFALSDVGRERKLNEDSFLADPELGLFIVCDGMGGHAAGEVASNMAATTVHAHVAANASAISAVDAAGLERTASILREAIELASSRIYQLGQSDQGKKGMGTTCTALLVRAGKGVMAHVGDSRLYLVRKGQLHQLSEDHTFLNEAVKHGIMTPEQAKQSDHHNIITRAVGPLERVIVDTLVFDVLDDDRFLLCSDGLHGYFEDPVELSGILASPAIEAAPKRMIDLANERGGHDNITAVVLRADASSGDALFRDEETSRATRVHAVVDTLRHIQLFEELSMPEILRVSHACRSLEFEPEQAIIREGETSESLFLLVSGQVVVERHDQAVAILGAGSHFGEMALLSQRPRSATVKARAKSTVLVLDRPVFFSLLQQDAVLATKFLWRLAQSLSLRLDDFYELQEVNAQTHKNTLRFGLYPSPFNYAPTTQTDVD